jgi:hypothetical protein
MPQQMLPGLMIITGAMGVSGGLLYTIQWAFEGSAVGDHTDKSNRTILIRCVCLFGCPQKKHLGADEWDYLLKNRDTRLKAGLSPSTHKGYSW